jgi:tetratricopeptide (TPR) repeat protein
MKKVMISSTIIDLSEHRKELIDACLRQGVFPMMMEHLPASDLNAMTVSLNMVDEADIYLGILGHYYGDVPSGSNITLTEMEYNRAVDRRIPRLIFITDNSDVVETENIELNERSIKLKHLKERLLKDNIVNFFKSPIDLRAKVINALSQYRELNEVGSHSISSIPIPPKPYFPHVYTLLQTHDLIGRQSELALLTKWVASPESDVFQAPVLNLVGIGGMGKSALAWKWFKDFAPQIMKPLAGQLWWSFYQTDIGFQDFIDEALAYVTGHTRRYVEETTKPGEREGLLLAELNRNSFLLAIDGLERIFVGYKETELKHSGSFKEAPDHSVEEVALVEPSRDQVQQRVLRKASDPRVGNFLRKLASVKTSRILITTRLYPADLETVTGDHIPGSVEHSLRGLNDAAALDLWREFGVSGEEEPLLKLFHSFGNYPLLIRALAGEVANYRRSPGNFSMWRHGNPSFNPFTLPLVQVQSHVLKYALSGLTLSARKVIYIIAALRMPATYNMLCALLVDDRTIRSKLFWLFFWRKPFSDESILDNVLKELEERGLIGWDKNKNCYDMHPVIKGVIRSELNRKAKNKIYRALQSYFLTFSPFPGWGHIKKLDDLTVVIELYNAWVGQERYEAAARLYKEYLRFPLEFRLGFSRLAIELLEMLFPNGIDKPPRLNRSHKRSWVISSLARNYHTSGQPALSIQLEEHIEEELGRFYQPSQENVAVQLCNFAGTYYTVGNLYKAERSARGALLISRQQPSLLNESVSLQWLGLVLLIRGLTNEASIALRRAFSLLKDDKKSTQVKGMCTQFMAIRSLWMGNYKHAQEVLRSASKLASQAEVYEIDFVRIAMLKGRVSLGLNHFKRADEILHQTLARVRSTDFREEELQILVALAKLRQLQKKPEAARGFLEDVWEPARRGPYTLIEADAYNVLAEIEYDVGNMDAAIEAASNAYRAAWCDGTPFVYFWGLEAAKERLKTLRVTEPSGLPSFDRSMYEPMVIVEINPPHRPFKEI